MLENLVSPASQLESRCLLALGDGVIHFRRDSLPHLSHIIRDARLKLLSYIPGRLISLMHG